MPVASSPGPRAQAGRYGERGRVEVAHVGATGGPQGGHHVETLDGQPEPLGQVLLEAAEQRARAGQQHA